MTKRELKDIAEDPATLLVLAISGPSLYTQETTKDLKELRIRYEAVGIVLNILGYVRELNTNLFPTQLSHEMVLRGFDAKIPTHALRERNKRVAVVAEDMLQRIGIKLRINSDHWKTITVLLPPE